MENRPEYYSKLPDGVRCRCIHLWREIDGSHWCCNVAKAPQPAQIDDDAPKVSKLTYEDDEKILAKNIELAKLAKENWR